MVFLRTSSASMDCCKRSFGLKFLTYDDRYWFFLSTSILMASSFAVIIVYAQSLLGCLNLIQVSTMEFTFICRKWRPYLLNSYAQGSYSNFVSRIGTLFDKDWLKIWQLRSIPNPLSIYVIWGTLNSLTVKEPVWKTFLNSLRKSAMNFDIQSKMFSELLKIQRSPSWRSAQTRYHWVKW